MQTDRDRLIKLIGDKITTSEFENYNSFEYAEHLADHLLINGMIVPPCKVGDTVYRINGSRIEKFKVARFVISSYGIRAEDLYGVQVALIDDFGKTVFLTKEEAEKALAERSEGNA